MANSELMSNEEAKEMLSKRAKGFIAYLMATSVFLNSMGFNLMAINAAITEYIVASIEYKKVQPVIDTRLMERLIITEREIVQLKKDNAELKRDSHEPKKEVN